MDDTHFLIKFFQISRGFPKFFGKIMFRGTKFRGKHPKSRKLVPAKISFAKISSLKIRSELSWFLHRKINRKIMRKLIEN